MRSAFAAFLRGFTLPFGVSSGRRIVFNGVDGTIEIYRADNSLAIQIGGPPPFEEDAIQFSTNDPDQTFFGQIDSGEIGVGGTRNVFIRMLAPAFTGATDIPSIQVRSQSQDLTEPPEIRLEHDGPIGRLRVPAVIGEATLVAGTVAVADASVLATSRIYLSRRVAGGTLGFLTYVLTAGVGFTINSSSATDTSTVSWAKLDE